MIMMTFLKKEVSYRNGLATHFTGKTKLALKECQVMGTFKISY